MVAFLDDLDSASPPAPVGERVLAALGPRMLELARDRSAGAHPYLTTPDHTASARKILGREPLLAPEQMVILSSEARTAREIGRATLATYLALPNYTNNLLRHGFSQDDLAQGGSDRLVDRVMVWGTLDAVAARIREHHDAGADHVCIQVLTPMASRFPTAQWRELATLLREFDES
jgi:probable F420-dependent oxidoreductase